MFDNKHVITALIVAPLLAVGSYFAVDSLVAEPPHQPQAGSHYPLATLPNCRHASGRCELQNGNFKLLLQGKTESDGLLALHLSSVFDLDRVYISVVEHPAARAAPVAMQAVKGSDKVWRVALPGNNPQQQYLRLVVVVESSSYYAETRLSFLDYKTSFQQDFRSPD